MQFVLNPKGELKLQIQSYSDITTPKYSGQIVPLIQSQAVYDKQLYLLTCEINLTR